MSQTHHTTSSPTAEVPPWAAGTEGRDHEMDPVLDEKQIDVVRQFGTQQSYAQGDLLWQAGQMDTGLFLVTSGRLTIVRGKSIEAGQAIDPQDIIITHEQGHYAGETVTMSGGGALVNGMAETDMTAIVVPADALRDMMAIHPELGEIILQSFILRRMRMIASNHGDIKVIGSPHHTATANTLSFLSRNGLPLEFISIDDQPEAAQQRMEQCDAQLSDLPVVQYNNRVLKQPDNLALAELMGIAVQIDPERLFDLCVIGSGPAGLASAVYAASEGLSVVVIESCVPGGQAGSSSKIENYLGFPTGISGQALTGRAFLQAQKFGALIAIAREVTAVDPSANGIAVALDGKDCIHARSVVLASGAVYRSPEIPGLESMSGVHYGASHVEGQLCRQQHVAIVGGGNSAGQAAIYLSARARKVSLMIRGESLASSMSDYLIRRIDSIDNIELMTHTEVQSLQGQDRIDSIRVGNNQTGEVHELDATHLFVFIGAKPCVDYLDDLIAQDDRGFVLTGNDLEQAQLDHSGWTESRRPYALESSCPGIFAVGDVRSGSVKRVASAVGEGSVCVQFVHKVLAENAR